MSIPAPLSLVVTLAAIGGVLVVVLRWWSRRSAAVQAGADLRSLFERDVAPSGVDWSTYEAVALAVSDAYGVHPGWLQPHDLRDKLFGLDSWDLGTGTEQLEALIAEQFGAV